jgi:hypothetical protein
MQDVASLINIGRDLPGYALSVFLIVIIWQGVRVLREEMRNNRDALNQVARMYTKNTDEMADLRSEIHNLKVTIEVGFERLPIEIQAAIAKGFSDQINRRPTLGPLARLFGLERLS